MRTLLFVTGADVQYPNLLMQQINGDEVLL